MGSLAADGDVYCLTGDLGAGKTLLSRGIAAGLGADVAEVNSPTFAIMNVYGGRLEMRVNSPTFAIMNVYGGRLEMRHFDLYRIKDADELYNTGFGEYCGGDGVTVVEWGELFIDELPEEYLHITIEIAGSGRKVIFNPHGARYEKLCKEVEEHADTGN